MNFNSFKENVKQLLKSDCLNEMYNEVYIFIENYSVSTQHSGIKLGKNTTLVKRIVSLLDIDIQFEDLDNNEELKDLTKLKEVDLDITIENNLETFNRDFGLTKLPKSFLKNQEVYNLFTKP